MAKIRLVGSLIVKRELINCWTVALKGQLEPWELSALEDPSLLQDVFSGSLKFGTGGIRAIMGLGPNRMNSLTIGKAAQGLANWLNRKPGEKTVAIAYDTRIHSKDFAEVTACVLAANGIKVQLFREHQPTPVLDFATRELGCDAGVCLTASHNPREYNGFKVYGADGVQATDEMAHAIQAEIELIDPFADVRSMSLEKALEEGLVSYIDEAFLDTYQAAVLDQRLGVDCTDLRAVYSPLNGTGLKQAEAMLKALGVAYTLVEAQTAPDGNFPNCPKPNPENASAMEMGIVQMAAEHADIFLATDPDADRVGVACMDNGSPRLLTGNEVGLLLFDWVCRHKKSNNTKQVAVTTIVTAPLADTIAEANDVELRRTLTGFKYVGEQIGLIQNEGSEFLLGIEESDGYLPGSYVRDKDGICGIMLVCEVAAYYEAKGMTLADALEALYERYGYMLGKQLVTEYPGEAGKASMAALMDGLRHDAPQSIAGMAVQQVIDYLPGAPMPITCGTSGQTLPPSNVLEWRLEGGSRVLLRPSGTEPKLKVYVFAKADEQAAANALLNNLCNEISVLLKD